MRHALIALLVLAPLATACKKSAPVEAPAEEPAPAPPPPAPKPDLEWAIGDATYAGGHMADSKGTLTIPVTLTANVEGKSLLVKSWDVGVKGPDGRVCIARSDEAAKTSKMVLEFALTSECMHAKLPEGEMVTVVGTVMYELGGEPGTYSVDQKVKLTR
ncbi:MAG: hypothetical protein H6733_13520 [Alphaproteobacteria bacterium]|nr:hypothetical protein [Alphaproteobacteria bacterium]